MIGRQGRGRDDDDASIKKGKKVSNDEMAIKREENKQYEIYTKKRYTIEHIRAASTDDKVHM